jgi:hypothetical protein
MYYRNPIKIMYTTEENLGDTLGADYSMLSLLISIEQRL